MTCNSETSTVSSPLAKFLLTLNVALSSVIVVDNARPTVLDRELIVQSRECRASQEDPDIAIAKRRNGAPPLGKKRRLRVSFDYKVRVVNYSKFTNTDNLFYTQKEYKKMRKEIKATLVRHRKQNEDEQSSSEDDSIDCMRGIEAYLEDEKATKNRARLHASLAVLTEQRRQNIEDGNVIPLDERELSCRYQQVSSKCQREALQRGLKDWIAACPASNKSIKYIINGNHNHDHGAPTLYPKLRAVSSYAA